MPIESYEVSMIVVTDYEDAAGKKETIISTDGNQIYKGGARV